MFKIQFTIKTQIKAIHNLIWNLFFGSHFRYLVRTLVKTLEIINVNRNSKTTNQSKLFEAKYMLQRDNNLRQEIRNVQNLSQFKRARKDYYVDTEISLILF